MPFHYISRRRQIIKSFYSGIGKTAVIFPAAFLMALGQGHLMLGMVFYLREVYHASGIQIGAFFALWSLVYILGCLVIRPLTDRMLPRYQLIIATLGMTVFTLCMHYGGRLVLAYVFYACSGVAASLFWPPAMGWLSADLAGAKLGRVMSRFNISWSVGAILSPFLAGWLSEQGPQWPVFAAVGFFLFAAVLISGAALALPKVRGDRHSAATANEQNHAEDQSTPLRFSAWVGAYNAFLAIGIIICIFPLAAREHLFFTKRLIGLLLLSRAFFTMLAMAMMGRTAFWHHRSNQIILGQLALAGAIFLMRGASHPLWIGVLISLVGLSMGISYFNSMFHGMAGCANRAARSAIHEALISAGLITGTTLGGFLYQRFSIQAAYLTCAAIILAGVLIQALISWYYRQAIRAAIDT